MLKKLTLKALAAVLICAGGVVGCSREESAESQISPSAPESYMNDPKFMAKVEAQDQAKREVMKAYSEVKAEYAAAVKADPKGAKTAELKAKLVDLEKKFEEIRKATAKIVGDRLRAGKSKAK